VLDGGAGNDVLTGGAGNDSFVFDTALNALTNVDTVADFNVAQDTVRLDHAIFTTLAVGTLASNAFFIGAAAHDADDRIIYNAGNGFLEFDIYGNAHGGAIHFATIAPHLALHGTDFIVIA